MRNENVFMLASVRYNKHNTILILWMCFLSHDKKTE